MKHFPLQAHGFLADSLSVLAGKAGLLNRDFRLATTCSFDGRSFPSRYCSTSDFGWIGSTSFAWTLAFFCVLYLLLSWTASFYIKSTYPAKMNFQMPYLYLVLLYSSFRRKCLIDGKCTFFKSLHFASWQINYFLPYVGFSFNGLATAFSPFNGFG